MRELVMLEIVKRFARPTFQPPDTIGFTVGGQMPRVSR
jgi:hypothetical protein